MARIKCYDLFLDKNLLPYLSAVSEFGIQAEKFMTPKELAGILKELFQAQDRAEEHLYLLCRRGEKIVGMFDAAHGGSYGMVISPREIFQRALLCGATDIFIVHNHPSGKLSPSAEDRAFTKRIKEAGALMGIQLNDSVIISREGYFSFLEKGYL